MRPTYLLAMFITGFAACASAHRGTAERPSASGTRGEVTGQVRNREAGPAPFALVAAVAEQVPHAAIERTVCDANGRFAFRQLRAGEYSFVAFAAPGQPMAAGSTMAMPVDDALTVNLVLDQTPLHQ